MEAIETIEGVKVNGKVFYDEWSMDPRTEQDNAGTMVCFHGRYSLGDKTNYRSRDYDGWEELKVAIERDNGKCIFLPLYLYDHSGITIATSPFSCPWDSGQVGFIFISRKDAVKEWGGKVCSKKVIEKAIAYLQGEVELYDLYLRNEVYMIAVEPKDTRELLEVCGGYYGMDSAIESVKEIMALHEAA